MKSPDRSEAQGAQTAMVVSHFPCKFRACSPKSDLEQKRRLSGVTTADLQGPINSLSGRGQGAHCAGLELNVVTSFDAQVNYEMYQVAILVR
jgi:hypothetical protein